MKEKTRFMLTSVLAKVTGAKPADVKKLMVTAEKEWELTKKSLKKFKNGKKAQAVKRV